MQWNHYTAVANVAIYLVTLCLLYNAESKRNVFQTQTHLIPKRFLPDEFLMHEAICNEDITLVL